MVRAAMMVSIVAYRPSWLSSSEELFTTCLVYVGVRRQNVVVVVITSQASWLKYRISTRLSSGWISLGLGGRIVSNSNI